MAQLRQGETTVDQAVAVLGKPTSRTVNSGGATVLVYSYARAQARPETFIPIVGPFVGGADSYHSSAVLIFGPDGTLQRYSSTEGGSGMGMGVASGSVRERQDGPTEAR